MVADPVRGAAIAAIGFLLLALATIDLRTYRLPDALTAAIAVLAAFLGASRGSIHLLIGLGAALFTFLVLAGVRRLTASVRGEAGLGFGDVKLATALALWLAAVMPWVIILASLVGLVHAALSRPEAGRIPFGPSLALAGFGVGIVMEYFWGGWAW